MNKETLSEEEQLQFQNPDAPNYDWHKDREWFNQRLASERIRNASLHNRLVTMRRALKEIKSPKARAALTADDAARVAHDGH